MPTNFDFDERIYLEGMMNPINYNYLHHFIHHKMIESGSIEETLMIQCE